MEAIINGRGKREEGSEKNTGNLEIM